MSLHPISFPAASDEWLSFAGERSDQRLARVESAAGRLREGGGLPGDAAPGGSRDAADLVAAFLGRGFTVDAYREWLAEGIDA